MVARSKEHVTGGSTQLPRAPAAPPQRGISAQALSTRIDAFLSSRGYKAAGATPAPPPADPSSSPRSPEPQAVAEFVCEEDVRAALTAGRKLVVGEKTIITPSARDLGESSKVFVQASWPH